MKQHNVLGKQELIERTIRFFGRYGDDLIQIKELLNIRLTQLALAYTIDHNLPAEAVTVSTRVKTLNSFLKKMDNKAWPQFYNPTEVIQDLIGARVVCWFVDDCEGIEKLISSSKHLKIEEEVDDYIKQPKPSGYRAIHLLANVAYDSVLREGSNVVINSQDMICEIQIRTKLQDVWGEITHEFHYKAKNSGIDNKVYEKALSEISDRLSNEDKSLLTLRDAYQSLSGDKLKHSIREVFR